MSEQNLHKVLVFKRYHRFWHWVQSLQIVLLGITGFEIHGSLRVLGFERAVQVHEVVAWSLVVMLAFTIFWHFTTGEWRQYLPTGERAATQLRYYTVGIFKNEPHPYRKNELSRLNPLQRLTYLGFKLLIVPVMVTSGFLYMFYNQLPAYGIELGLSTIAPIHTAGAFILVAFFVVHVYMTTTGQSVWTNLKAMITGYEEMEPGSMEPRIEPSVGD